MCPTLAALAVLVAAPLASQVARPTPDQLATAHKTVQEVFGDEISKARTPDDHAALAAKLLRTAETEQDAANLYALAVETFNQAVAGKDADTALDAVRLVVERFAAEEGKTALEWLDAAEAKWKEAGKAARKGEVAGLRFVALEGYLRVEGSAEATPLEKKLAEKQVEEFRGKVGVQPFRVPKGCVLYFAFEKGDFFQKDGKVWVKDRSGRSNHGETIGGVRLAKEDNNTGIALDGQTGHVRVLHSPSLDLTFFTLAAWVCVAEWRNHSSPIIAKDDDHLLRRDDEEKGGLFTVGEDT